MRGYAPRLILLMIVFLSALLYHLTTAKAITFTGTTTWQFTCNSVQAISSATYTYNRNTSGTGSETTRITVTDGVGTVLYTNTYTYPIGSITTWSTSLVRTFITAPVANPIRLRFYSLAGNSLPEQTIQSVAYNCPDLPSGACPIFFDGRLNNCDAGQTAAVYCEQDGSITVFALYDSKGYKAFTVSSDELAKMLEHPERNTLIKENLGARLYRLTSGKLQINRAETDSKKDYVFIFNGCTH